MTEASQVTWSSLETAKLVVSLITPIMVLIIGIGIHRVTKKFENIQWKSQKLIEKRLAIYDDLAPDLNDLLSYFTYIGCWKDFEPDKIIKMKRTVDKKIYLAAPLMSKEFFDHCIEFMSICFDTYNGWGEDAKLRTNWRRRKEYSSFDWSESWELCFSNDIVDPEVIKQAYKKIMERFTHDIGVNPSAPLTITGGIPINIE